MENLDKITKLLKEKEDFLKDIDKIERIYLKALSTNELAMCSGEILEVIRNIKEKAKKKLNQKH